MHLDSLVMLFILDLQHITGGNRLCVVANVINYIGHSRFLKNFYPYFRETDMNPCFLLVHEK